MARTLQRPTKSSDYIINFYKTHKFDQDSILITTDHSGWALLNKEEFRLLKAHKVERDPELFSVLKEKGIIITEDSFANVVESYRKKHRFLFHGPTLHIVVPTFRCNMKCAYCHSKATPPSDKSQDMDKETAEKIADFILQCPTDTATIEFQGGECSLNLEVVEHFIKYILDNLESSRKFKFSLVSNLTALDFKQLDRLTELLTQPKHGILSLNTSLDGPKEIHNKNRKYLDGGGTYNDVISKLEEVRSAEFPKVRVAALSTVTKHTIDGGHKLVDEYAKRDLNTVWLRPLNNMGYAQDTWQKIGYTAEEYVDFWRQELDYILQLNREGKDMEEGWAKIISSKILRENAIPFVDLISPCGAAIQQLTYDNKGRIFTCDEGKIFDEFQIGNVHEDSYPDIFERKKVSSMIDVSTQLSSACDACVWQPFCGICPVLSYATQGNIIPQLPKYSRCTMFSNMIEEVFQKLLFSDEDAEVIEGWQKTLPQFLDK